MHPVANRTIVLFPLAGILAPDSLTRALAGTALLAIIVNELLPSRRAQACVRAVIIFSTSLLVGSYLAACGASARRTASSTSTTGEREDGIDIVILDRSRTLSFPSIVFEPDSTTLSGAARDDLTALAERLSTAENAVLHLTDHSTSEAAGLGDRRVHAIEDFLVELGVDPSRIQSTKSREGIR